MKLQLLVLLSTVAFAAAAAPKPVMTAEGKPGRKLILQHIDVSVRIHGPAAETRIKLVFHNPHKERLTGDFRFPLPPDAVVTGYALNIGPKLREGVVVERDKGRRTFDTIVRRMIDPGLLEVEDNTFRTRVFPMPAQGSRTIKVTYVQKLSNHQYELPLAFGLRVQAFTLSVRTRAAAQPAIVCGGSYGLDFVPTNAELVATSQKKNWYLKEDLVIRVKPSDSNVYAQRADDGYVYFIADYKPRVDASSTVLPECLTIVWDASRSRDRVDHETEFELLRALFSLLPDRTTVAVRIIRHKLSSSRVYEIAQGRCEAALRFLKTTEYDGAVFRGAFPSRIHRGVALFFTDGARQFGQWPEVMDRPVYAVTQRQAPKRLREFTRRSGGNEVNLKEESVAQAVKGIISPPVVLSVGPRTVDILQTDRNGGATFHVIGRCRSATKVTLCAQRNGTPIRSVRREINVRSAPRGQLLRNVWALHRKDQLLASGATKQEILALGREFNIATPWTSFIVLESVAQYIEFGIVPPKSEPELLAAYRKVVVEHEWSAGKGQADQWARLVNAARLLQGDEEVLAGGPLQNCFDWFLTVQNEDGSWGSKGRRVEATAMVLKAFLQQGETPLSEKYGTMVQKAMKWLGNYMNSSAAVKTAKGPRGAVAHALATETIAESYAMTRIPFLRKPMDRGVAMILSRQLPNGAFHKSYARRVQGRARWDLRSTVHQASALKAAYLAGCAEGGLEPGLTQLRSFLEKTAYIPAQAGFSRDGRPQADRSMTAGTVYALCILGAGQSKTAKAALSGVIKRELPNIERVSKDGKRWSGLAPAQLGVWADIHVNLFLMQNRREWRPQYRQWRSLNEGVLMRTIHPLGYWSLKEDAPLTDRLITTCRAMTSLQVYYRYLPTFSIESLRDHADDSDDTIIEIKGDNSDGLVIEIDPSVLEVAPTPPEPEEPVVTKSEQRVSRRRRVRAYGVEPTPEVIPCCGADFGQRRTTYLDRLRETAESQQYAYYLLQARAHADDPLFFVNCADYFFAAGDNRRATQIVMNLIGLQGGQFDPAVSTGRRLMLYGQPELAVLAFRNALRQNEPAEHDLAGALITLARTAIHRGDDARAKLLLQEATELHLQAAKEYDSTRALIALQTLTHEFSQHLDKSRLPALYTEPFTADVMVHVRWTTTALTPRIEGKTVSTLKELATDLRGPEGMLLKAAGGSITVSLEVEKKDLPTGWGDTLLVAAEVEVIQYAGMKNERRKIYPIRTEKKPGDTIKVCTLTFD